mmetsp:Transcript_13329/g.48521  ORF Transcript_13329/g.48521 Transcript_13329/m.48521 type:complete len:213 (+) Transcript_13329:358-996(+)
MANVFTPPNNPWARLLAISGVSVHADVSPRPLFSTRENCLAVGMPPPALASGGSSVIQVSRSGPFSSAGFRSSSSPGSASPRAFLHCASLLLLLISSSNSARSCASSSLSSNAFRSDGSNRTFLALFKISNASFALGWEHLSGWTNRESFQYFFLISAWVCFPSAPIWTYGSFSLAASRRSTWASLSDELAFSSSATTLAGGGPTKSSSSSS